MVALKVDERNYVALSVDTPAMAVGVLEATATGRALMDTNYFDNTTTVSGKFTAGSVPLDRLEETVIQADGGQAFTGDQSHGGNKITSLAAGTASTDAVNLQQLNDSVSGLQVKDSVRCATQANLTGTGLAYANTGGTSARGQITWTATNGPTTIDGVTLANGDRILVKEEAGGLGGAANGIWVRTGQDVWDRAEDFDEDAEVTANAFTFVNEGTASADKGYTLTNDGTIIIGGASGTVLTWAVFTTASAANLAGVLAIGNVTGGTDLSLSSGDELISVAEMILRPTTSLDIFPGGETALTPDAVTVVNTPGHGVTIVGGLGGDTVGASQAGKGGSLSRVGGQGGANTTSGGGGTPGDTGDGGDSTQTGGKGGTGGGNGAATGGTGGTAGSTGGAGADVGIGDGNAGNGGIAQLIGGAGGLENSAANTSGGDVNIRGGAGGTGGTGTGLDGNVNIGTSDTNNTNIGNVTDHKEVAIKADSSATGLITFQSQGAGSAVPMQEAGDTEGLVLNAAFAGDSIIAAINENRIAAAAAGNTGNKNEVITTVNQTTDAALGDTLANAPLVVGDVQLKINGLEAINGVHFTVSGSTITWLGTVFELKSTDTLRAFYTSA